MNALLEIKQLILAMQKIKTTKNAIIFTYLLTNLSVQGIRHVLLILHCALNHCVIMLFHIIQNGRHGTAKYSQ